MAEGIAQSVDDVTAVLPREGALSAVPSPGLHANFAVLYTALHSLPNLAMIAVAALIVHLKPFNLTSIFHSPHSVSSFTSRTRMTLNGNTLSNLEIFNNSTAGDGTARGSLVELLGQTKTAFGGRLLRQWISRPLLGRS